MERWHRFVLLGWLLTKMQDYSFEKMHGMVLPDAPPNGLNLTIGTTGYRRVPDPFLRSGYTCAREYFVTAILT